MSTAGFGTTLAPTSIIEHLAKTSSIDDLISIRDAAQARLLAIREAEQGRIAKEMKELQRQSALLDGVKGVPGRKKSKAKKVEPLTHDVGSA